MASVDIWCNSVESQVQTSIRPTSQWTPTRIPHVPVSVGEILSRLDWPLESNASSIDELWQAKQASRKCEKVFLNSITMVICGELRQLIRANEGDILL